MTLSGDLRRARRALARSDRALLPQQGREHLNLQQIAADISSAFIPSANNAHCRIAEPDTVQQLLEAVEAGNYIETSAELAGLPKQTLYNWLKRAETGEEPFAALSDALKRASARAEAKAVANVRRAGLDDRFWAAEMTYLERRHPERWARRSEEGNSPRVVVQIGVRDSDVQVRIEGASAPAPTPLSLGEGQ